MLELYCFMTDTAEGSRAMEKVRDIVINKQYKFQKGAILCGRCLARYTTHGSQCRDDNARLHPVKYSLSQSHLYHAFGEAHWLTVALHDHRLAGFIIAQTGSMSCLFDVVCATTARVSQHTVGTYLLQAAEYFAYHHLRKRRIYMYAIPSHILDFRRHGYAIGHNGRETPQVQSAADEQQERLLRTKTRIKTEEDAQGDVKYMNFLKLLAQWDNMRIRIPVAERAYAGADIALNGFALAKNLCNEDDEDEEDEEDENKT